MSSLDAVRSYVNSFSSAKTTPFAAPGTQGGGLLGETAVNPAAAAAAAQMGAWSAARGQAPITAANTPGVHVASSYNTGLDKGVGDLDSQIKAMDAYKGTSSFDQKKYDDLTKQRQALNIQRWQSVKAGDAGPGFKAVQQALARGDLTMDDLGGLDISLLSNDAALAGQVDALVAQKKAAQVSPDPVAATPDPTVQEQADATGAVDNSLASAQDYVKSQMGDLNTFDQGVQSTENQEASAGANLAHMAGAEAAGMAAGQAGANTAAQGAAGRNVLQQNQKSDLESFLSDSLEKDIGDNSDLAKLDVTKRVQVQQQAADHLVDTITKSIGTADAGAQGQLQDLQSAINDWKAHMQDQAQSQEKWMKIVKIAGGLLMTGAGAALTAGTGGLGAAGGVGLITAGVGQTINGAAS